MKTPTRRNLFASTGVAEAADITHATESRSLSRPNRSFNPFCKGTDEPSRRVGVVPPLSLEVFTSPPSRQKRMQSGDFDCNNSLSILKRLRSQRSTPTMNGSMYAQVSMARGEEGMWKHRSSLLSKLSEHQQKADKILFDVSLVLRDVDKCNAQLKGLCISP